MVSIKYIYILRHYVPYLFKCTTIIYATTQGEVYAFIPVSENSIIITHWCLLVLFNQLPVSPN